MLVKFLNVFLILSCLGFLAEAVTMSGFWRNRETTLITMVTSWLHVWRQMTTKRVKTMNPTLLWVCSRLLVRVEMLFNLINGHEKPQQF